jgi:pimeloyl-ACP methyl ester carboxylesterase
MNKRLIRIIVSLLVLVGLIFAGRQIRNDHYPLPVEPSPEWEPIVSSLDAQREAFFVNSDGTMLEAEIFIPNGGSDKKPAVVFTPGSGDSAYQNYGHGLVETYILDVFLQHDFAVLLVNKRGMGQSEGNYVKNSIEGRVEDIWSAVQSIQNHPKIDATNIGLVGHSQGGRVVTQAAADHEEIAFFISLACPTMSMRENAADNAYHSGICQGMRGEEIEAHIENQSNLIDLSIKIGNLTNFGFDARNMEYDPQLALQTVEMPGVFIFAENDDQVTPALNIERLETIFDGEVPLNLSTVIIDAASHRFLLVDNPCVSRINPEEKEQSAQLTEVLNAWLTEQGY